MTDRDHNGVSDRIDFLEAGSTLPSEAIAESGRRWRLLVGGLALAAIAALTCWAFLRESTPTPIPAPPPAPTTIINVGGR